MEEKVNIFVKFRRWRKETFGGYYGSPWRNFWFQELQYWFPFKQIKHIKYWIKYRTTDRYNTVNMGKTLIPSYYDIDTRLIHSNFTLLSQYVENEMDRICWDDEPHARVKKEIDELYKWWKEVFPNYEKNNPLYAPDVKCPEHKTIVHKVDEDGDPELYEWVTEETPESIKFSQACHDSHIYEANMEAEIEENLIRLIRIRKYLWS